MRYLRGLGSFLYGLIIGDDWRITAGVVASLVVGRLLLSTAIPAPVVAVLTALLLGGWFSAILLRTGRRPAAPDTPD